VQKEQARKLMRAADGPTGVAEEVRVLTGTDLFGAEPRPVHYLVDGLIEQARQGHFAEGGLTLPASASSAGSATVRGQRVLLL
jgi:hypothetical protein